MLVTLHASPLHLRWRHAVRWPNPFVPRPESTRQTKGNTGTKTVANSVDSSCYTGWSPSLDMSQNFLLLVATQWGSSDELCFMYKAASSSFGSPIREKFDNRFPSRWIWRRSAKQKLLRIPDLTPCYSCWGSGSKISYPKSYPKRYP
jgi:hypothetical protein